MSLKILRYFIVLLSIFAQVSWANTIYVQSNKSLQNILNQANSGDRIVLAAGHYLGNLVIKKKVTLTTDHPHQAIIFGERKGSTITINSDDVIIEKLTIEHSGLDLSTQDSGIFINKGAKNTIIRENLIRDNLIGVYLWGSISSKVLKNQIIGQKFKHVNDRGNGVQVWSSPGSIVKGNRIEYGRDGIFTTTSKDNLFEDNYFRHLRYSIHYMYTTHSTVRGNYSIGNDIGYALMFSDYLKVYNNVSIASKEHGVLIILLINPSFQAILLLGRQKNV